MKSVPRLLRSLEELSEECLACGFRKQGVLMCQWSWSLVIFLWRILLKLFRVSPSCCTSMNHNCLQIAHRVKWLSVHSYPHLYLSVFTQLWLCCVSSQAKSPLCDFKACSPSICQCCFCLDVGGCCFLDTSPGQVPELFKRAVNHVKSFIKKTNMMMYKYVLPSSLTHPHKAH